MNKPQVKLTIREGDAPLGEIILELCPDKAPGTVENFLKLVKSGHYDGLIFHRVIKSFMIQGGGLGIDFEPRAELKPIRGEFIANGFMGNDIRHVRGTVSMARTSDPDSATSQFFIMHEDAPHLDAQYAAFGHVISGMDVVDKIASCKTGRYQYYTDVPRVTIVIEHAEIL